MTPATAILLLALPLAPPSPTDTLGAPGCGAVSLQFDVKVDSGKHPAPAPEPAKALLFFIQDDARFRSVPRPTTRFGIDGAWVGATHANSYFYVSVDPGEHHLCANWQSGVVAFAATRPTSALHFTAEAGKTYSFVARDRFNTEHGLAEVILEPVDTDEARLLMNSFAFSSSRPRK